MEMEHEHGMGVHMGWKCLHGIGMDWAWPGLDMAWEGHGDGMEWPWNEGEGT